MTNFFKKIGRGAKKFFGKVKTGINDTFKKGGYLSQGLDYANKGLEFGNKIVGAIEKVPILGQALTPLTTAARAGLSIGNRLVDGVRAGQNAAIGMVGAARRGESVDNKLMDGLKSGYGGAKGLIGEAKGINFKGAAKESKTNVLEKAKEVRAGDGVKFA